MDEQFPQWFKNFDQKKFVLMEDSKNQIYYSRELLEYWKPQTEFHEEDFDRGYDPKGGYPVYHPKELSQKKSGLYPNRMGQWVHTTTPPRRSYLLER